MVRRPIVMEADGAADVITTLGALSALEPHLGVCLAILGGRSLPVAVRELTTLDHLSGGDLVVLLDPTGCTDAQVEEAVELLVTMASHEVTTLSGPTWVLHDAPNRPLPLSGAFSLFLFSQHSTGDLHQVSLATGLTVVGPGESGRAGEVWEFISVDEAISHVERSRSPFAP